MTDRPDILLDHERRISTLEGITAEIRETLSSVASRLNSMEARVDARFNEVNHRITTLTGITIGLWITTIATLIGLFLGVR